MHSVRELYSYRPRALAVAQFRANGISVYYKVGVYVCIYQHRISNVGLETMITRRSSLCLGTTCSSSFFCPREGARASCAFPSADADADDDTDEDNAGDSASASICIARTALASARALGRLFMTIGRYRLPPISRIRRRKFRCVALSSSHS